MLMHSGKNKGLFITLEGIDGSGKTTQAKRLYAYCKERNIPVKVLREPGGSEICERIRALLLDAQNSAMSETCELLLYEASRAQLTEQVILPLLDQGVTVICDRYYDSTYAYQCGGRKLSAQLVHQANTIASKGLTPDLTFLFDLDVEVAHTRQQERADLDRLEREGLVFMQDVRRAYLELAEQNERIVCVDASASEDEVFKTVKTSIDQLLTECSCSEIHS